MPCQHGKKAAGLVHQWNSEIKFILTLSVTESITVYHSICWPIYHLEGPPVVAAPHVDADDGVLQVRRDDHLEDARRVRHAALKVLQERALVVNSAIITGHAI